MGKVTLDDAEDEILQVLEHSECCIIVFKMYVFFLFIHFIMKKL